MHLWLLYHAGARRGSRRRGAGNLFLLAASSPHPPAVSRYLLVWIPPDTFVPRRVPFASSQSLSSRFVSPAVYQLRDRARARNGGESVDSGFREEKVGRSISPFRGRTVLPGFRFDIEQSESGAIRLSAGGDGPRQLGRPRRRQT